MPGFTKCHPVIQSSETPTDTTTERLNCERVRSRWQARIFKLLTSKRRYTEQCTHSKVRTS